MEEQKPRISVIVPVYNVEAYVKKCLASLAAQTYPNMEIILVDDASTDGGGRICDAWAARDGRFQVLHLSENRGLSNARNVGVNQAAGDYIAFVDPDDYVEPGLLDVLYRTLKENCADISICGNIGLRLGCGSAQIISREGAVQCLARRSCFLWTVWGKLFPAELAKQNPFDRQALCCEDLLFFYQILKQIQRIAYVPDPLYHYVYRENSLVNHGVTEKRCIVFSVLDWICKDASANFPEAETCFRQTALDTAARLAMQTVSADADKNTRNYLERFRDVVRCHFSWRALALCPDGKSAATELALWGGIPIFKVLAAIYRLIKHMKKKQGGVTGENGQSGSH